MKTSISTCLLASLFLPACGGNDAPEEPTRNPPAQERPSSDASTATSTTDHGASKDLGQLTVAGREFDVVRMGELEGGKECAFQVHPRGASAKEIATLNLYLWVESEGGTQLSASSKGSVEGDALHFHVTPRKGDESPHRVVLRLRSDGTDERSSLPLDGHGHEHHDGPHDGILAKFQGGETGGHLELKLHDDKGDLELWLAQDEKITQPFDLPLDAVVEIEFVDVDGRKVTLRARNQDANEDESGTPNVRDGKTNYFIYPSQEGEDASWLKGLEFQSIVIVRFTDANKEFRSEEFVLKPHTHG